MTMDASGWRRRPLRLRDRDRGKPFVLCRIGGNWVRFVKPAGGLLWFRLGIGIGFVSHFPEWRGEERGRTHKTRWTPHPRDAPPFGNRDVGKPCILWGVRGNWVRFVKRAAGLGWLGLGVGIGFVWYFPESVGKNAGGPTDWVGNGPVTDAGTSGATGTEMGSFRISGFRAFRRLELARLAAICSEKHGVWGVRHAVILPPSESHEEGLQSEIRSGQVTGRNGVVFLELAVTEKGFISFAARKSAGRRTGLTAAKVMKPCSELNRRRRVGL